MVDRVMRLETDVGADVFDLASRRARIRWRPELTAATMLGMGICEECGFDWGTPAHELAERVGQMGPRYRQQLERFAGLAESRRYNNEHVDEVLDSLDRAAGAASVRLETLTRAQWARVGIGSEGDERNVLVLARRLAHEGEHHLLDLTTGHTEAL